MYHYVNSFTNNEVGGQELLNIRPYILEQLGMYSISHQEIVLEAVKLLRNFVSDTFSEYILVTWEDDSRSEHLSGLLLSSQEVERMSLNFADKICPRECIYNIYKIVTQELNSVGVLRDFSGTDLFLPTLLGQRQTIRVSFDKLPRKLKTWFHLFWKLFQFVFIGISQNY